MKVGYQGNRLDQLDQTIANQPQLAYRFNQGVPNAVTYRLPDFGRRTITSLAGFFVQDSWTRGRLTLQGALRYDRASSYAPVPSRTARRSTSFLNPAPITIQETPGVNAYNDLTPRVGVAYDVFGNGKTAVKVNWGKYLAYAANDPPYTSTNPGFTVVRERPQPRLDRHQRQQGRRLRPAQSRGPARLGQRRRLRRRRRQRRPTSASSARRPSSIRPC